MKAETELKPLKEQANNLEDGVKKEVFRKGNKTITSVIITKSGLSKEYRRVVTDWGGNYFFKDDISITELEWNKEVSNYLKEK